LLGVVGTTEVADAYFQIEEWERPVICSN